MEKQAGYKNLSDCNIPKKPSELCTADQRALVFKYCIFPGKFPFSWCGLLSGRRALKVFPSHRGSGRGILLRSSYTPPKQSADCDWALSPGACD